MHQQKLAQEECLQDARRVVRANLCCWLATQSMQKLQYDAVWPKKELQADLSEGNEIALATPQVGPGSTDHYAVVQKRH
jgi:hypothetical protein